MSYAIVGFGAVGQALAHAFARKNIDVTVASRRPPEALAPQALTIGPTVVAKSLRDALEADTIILALPFGEHREVAKALPSWKGKTVVDAMNALVPLEELDGLPSSAFVAKAFTGAKFVKGFNHLIAATLAADPIVEGGHRVVFLSSPLKWYGGCWSTPRTGRAADEHDAAPAPGSMRPKPRPGTCWSASRTCPTAGSTSISCTRSVTSADWRLTQLRLPPVFRVRLFRGDRERLSPSQATSAALAGRDPQRRRAR